MWVFESQDFYVQPYTVHVHVCSGFKLTTVQSLWSKYFAQASKYRGAMQILFLFTRTFPLTLTLLPVHLASLSLKLLKMQTSGQIKFV